MTIYGISGLGADKRVFNFLELDYPFVAIEWIKPNLNESIKSYAIRLSKSIDTSTDFILIGVSFGGLIAVELNKILNPRLTILVSSAETKHDLRLTYRLIGKTGIIKYLPKKFFSIPNYIATFIFTADNSILLQSILKDSDAEFTKWAINELVLWNNEQKFTNMISIHGTNDRLIPWNKSKQTVLIPNGGHFMIVDKASQISKVINDKLKDKLI